jgi:hypothetical protein
MGNAAGAIVFAGQQLLLLPMMAAWSISDDCCAFFVPKAATARGGGGGPFRPQLRRQPQLYSSSASTGSSGSTTATSSSSSDDCTSSASSSSLTLFSPCKINLFLRILGKRADGYHDLASLFQAVGFGDTLVLSPLLRSNRKSSGNSDDSDDDDGSLAAAADTFACNMEGVPTDSTNLVLRALELMRQKTGVSMHFAADLRKECPAQAGLGGGSANAATAMWGANELMGRPATVQQVRRAEYIFVFWYCCWVASPI